MRKSKFEILIILAIVLIHVCTFAHEQAVPLIVDTDVALDDIRAIILLLQSDMFDVHAFVTTDGGCSPDSGAEIINNLLSYLGYGNINIGFGPQSPLAPPPWRGLAESIYRDSVIPTAPGIISPALNILKSEINHAESKLIYLCLGPLTNLADLLRQDSSYKNKISAIYYRGNSPDSPKLSWNTARDTSAARIVFASGIPIYCNISDDSEEIVLDSVMLAEICALKTTASDLLCDIHSREPISRMVKAGHFRAWDESVVLSLLYPELARYAAPKESNTVRTLEYFDKIAGRNHYIELLKSGGSVGLKNRRPVVYGEYPSEPDYFRGDVAAISETTTERYGLEEWNSIILTSEIHTHLGIYTILGAKMGIRARELFNVGIDELRVESYAGNEPPISCFNDGLQVSTGATLGHGTITVNSNNPRLEASFTFGDRIIVLRLKDEIDAQIKSDIEQTLADSGGLNARYFAAIRKLAIKYWQELNRQDIFER